MLSRLGPRFLAAHHLLNKPHLPKGRSNNDARLIHREPLRIMTCRIITLTSDFGLKGPYVASMKGVILGINAEACVVDISHEVSPRNVREAALYLKATCPHFPPSTIHVAVVDPGVGTDRRLLYVHMHGQHFLAPDNGLLSWASQGAERIEFDMRVCG